MERMENTSDLRKFLLGEMQKLAEKKIEVQDARAMCNYAQQVYNTLKLEIQFATLRSKNTIEAVDLISQPKRQLRAA